MMSEIYQKVRLLDAKAKRCYHRFQVTVGLKFGNFSFWSYEILWKGGGGGGYFEWYVQISTQINPVSQPNKFTNQIHFSQLEC